MYVHGSFFVYWTNAIAFDIINLKGERSVKITVLTEDTSLCGLPSEHGLSLYIEANGRKILFDTGQSPLFSENAERLGIDLSLVDTAVISHGHYDHGGGLKRFLELNKTAPVYLSRHAFEPHYNGDRYIGLDLSLLDCDRLVLTDGELDLGDGLTLYPASVTPEPEDDGGLTMIKNGEKVADDFIHEQYLEIVENGTKTLISGCSHRGISGITAAFKPDALVGGFHFMKMELDEALAEKAERLSNTETSFFTCHCTGEAQFGFLKKHMKRLRYISTGDSFEIKGDLL